MNFPLKNYMFVYSVNTSPSLFQLNTPSILWWRKGTTGLRKSNAKWCKSGATGEGVRFHGGDANYAGEFLDFHAEPLTLNSLGQGRQLENRKVHKADLTVRIAQNEKRILEKLLMNLLYKLNTRWYICAMCWDIIWFKELYSVSNKSMIHSWV